MGGARPTDRVAAGQGDPGVLGADKDGDNDGDNDGDDDNDDHEDGTV